MPALGESVSEGTVTSWLKAEGDHVAMDEPLLEVSTDKVDTEIPSPVAGTLQKIIVAVDQTVPVGAELAIIADGAAPAAAPAVAAPVVAAPVVAAPVVAAPVVAAPVVAAPVVAQTQPLDAYVTPIVRKLATELGVNLSTVTGTGVGGRIRKEDVEAAAPKAAPAPLSPTPAAPVASAPAAPGAPAKSSGASVAVSPLRGTTVKM